MGKMKKAHIEIETSCYPLKAQKCIFDAIFKTMPKDAIEYQLKKAHGNLKVAMHMAYTDLEE